MIKKRATLKSRPLRDLFVWSSGKGSRKTGSSEKLTKPELPDPARVHVADVKIARESEIVEVVSGHITGGMITHPALDR